MTMATKTKREQWRALNLQLNSIHKTMSINTKAGYIQSEEYLQWVRDLESIRNDLTRFI